MHIFISQIRLNIYKIDKFNKNLQPDSAYNAVLENPTQLIPALLIEKILIKLPSELFLTQLLEFLITAKSSELSQVDILLAEKSIFRKILKSKYSILKAAGGVVIKERRILMIHRLGFWDLPKGKLGPKEKMKEAAVREVKEECNVEVTLKEKINTTWHYYEEKGNQIFKKTNWYLMYCTNDSKITPQKEESIDKVEWFESTDLSRIWNQTYPAIKFILDSYLKMD